MNPRSKRLLAEGEMLRKHFVGHPYVTVQPIGWHPPEQFRVVFDLPGVALDGAGQPGFVKHHVARISLGDDYPRRQPRIVMETPIFHPNFVPKIGSDVAVTDDWSASRTLLDTILELGDMIQFRIYDVHAPANPRAARWVQDNEGSFPIGRIALSEEA